MRTARIDWRVSERSRVDVSLIILWYETSRFHKFLLPELPWNSCTLDKWWIFIVGWRSRKQPQLDKQEQTPTLAEITGSPHYMFCVRNHGKPDCWCLWALCPRVPGSTQCTRYRSNALLWNKKWTKARFDEKRADRVRSFLAGWENYEMLEVNWVESFSKNFTEDRSMFFQQSTWRIASSKGCMERKFYQTYLVFYHGALQTKEWSLIQFMLGCFDEKPWQLHYQC